jgi:polyhydroxyalkanoate synthesis regulator phasin
MNTKGMKPGQPGWLGNPTKWEGNGGKPGVKIEDAIAAFRSDFLDKIEEDSEFKAAVLALRGKKIGYYKPQNENHLQVVQEWLANQPGEAPATPKKAEKTRTFADLPTKESGQKSMIYAGVGSRQTPDHVLAQMQEAARMLEEAGYSVRTGDAIGADQAFSSAVKGAEVFTADDATDETRAIAREIHPNPAALKTDKALNLQARNTYQIFGRNLDSPVDFVLTWTPDGAQHASETGHGRSYLPNTGGTGQAIRLASMKGIPVINMARAGWQKRLQAVLDGKDVLATPTELGTPRTQASTKPGDRVAGKKVATIPPKQLPAPSMDAEFGGARTQFAQPTPTVVPPLEEQKGHVSLKIIFPEGWSVSPSPSVNPNAKVRTVPYEGKVEYGRKERPADQSSPAAPAPAVQEKLLSEKLESFAQRGFEFEVDANGNPTDRLVSKLTEEQVRQLSEVADPEQNPFAIVDEGGFPADSKPPKAINYDARRRAVNKLIASGGLFTRPDLVSVEIPNNPDFEHAVYGLFDRKMDFGFFESAKAYWEHWRGMIHKDINEKDPVMRRMSPAMKVIYERMLIMERGFTIMSGKLAPEQRDAFDANISRIESEGAEAVDARVDRKTAMQIVAGLRQAVSERGEIGMQDFLVSNPHHEKRHRFAAFIKSEAIMRPGLTGQPGTLIFRFRKPGPDGKVGFAAEDYGKNPSTFVSDLTSFYNEILTHAASVGALNEDQAEFLKISHHRLDLLRESTLADVDPTEVGEPLNFTRDALVVALNETGMAGALKAGIPLPVTTVIGEKTEISEVLDRFHELKSQDESLDALTDSEFLIGIIGMGQDRAGKEADARLANAYDPAKAPAGLLAKLARAGFIKMKSDGYYAVGKFEGVLKQIRPQSFMKDMDQVYSPRQGFFSGPQYSPRIVSIPLGLDEVATLRPGSILIHPRRETFGVIGPVMENGRFTILVPHPSLKPGGPYYLAPAKGKDGKVVTFSKTRLGELGYHHVPAIWDLVQTKATGSGIQAQNVFSWVNAEAAIESRQALRHAAADTGLNLDGVGHGRLVSDPLGRSYLALASAGGPQFLLEVTDGESAPAARLEDAMARLHTQIRDAIGSIVGPETDELTANQMKKVRTKVRSLISDLVDRKQITEAEAKELRSEMASLYKAVLNSLDDINEADGPLMARLYQQLGKSGFLGTEQVQEYLVMQELMGATQELEEGGRSVDEDGQSQGSGFSHADALEMMSAESFTETLRDLFGLNKTESFAEAYQNLKDSAKLLMAEYRRAKREGAYPGLVGRLHRLTKAKLLALRAIKRNDLHLIARSTLDEKLGMDALKEASEVLGLRSSENRPDSQIVVERMFNEIANKPLPTSWLTDKSSPLYLAVPEAIRRKINAYVNFKTGKIEGIGSMLRGREQFTIASLSNTTHPRAKALGLYLYAALSSMPSIDGDKVTLLAANAAYFKAVSDLPLKMRDGSEKKLSELPAAERDMVKKVMMSGGLYAQLVSALQVTRRTFDENGNIVWPQDLTEWPKAGTADAKALYEMAMKFKIDSRQSTFGLMAALDLPRSATVDIEDLALRLGNQEIPADAALMLEGVAPEDRHFVYDYKAYRPEKPELFMQFSDNVHLRPDVFHELLEDAIRSDEPIVVDSSDAADVTMFEMDGVTYKLIPEDKLAEEADANAGIEIPYDNGVVTGADYEILQHMKQIFKGAFKLSGGAISRDGRSSTFVFNGQIYPADFRERFVSPFGNKLLEHFRALHDQAWTDDEFAIENPFQRQAIREQMFAWEQFALQHPKQAATVKGRGGFRTAKGKPKHALNVTPEAEPRFLADIRAKVIKMVSTLASIPQAERPNVVIHGVNETGESFLKTAEGRRLIPADIQAELLAEGGGKDAMKKLRLAMGLVTTDGAIHIFPGMHADAAGNIDNVELARTVFHEAVGHVALRHILGAEYESFMLSVFRNHVDPKGELSLTRDMKIQHAEEFIAAMADKISYNTSAQRLTNVHIGTILDRVGAMIMQAFRRFMSRLGFKVEISKVEIRELLARAFKGSDVKAAGLGFMGPAMMPAENLPNYEGMGQYEPNLADRFLRNVSDKLRYWELLFRSREASGERIRDEQNFMYALRTLNSRVGYMTDVSAKLEDRFIQSFRGKNFSQQDVGEVLLALHTLERAEQDAKDYLANIPVHMVRTGRDIPSPEEAARGITSEDKIAQEVAKAKKRIASGTLPASTGRAPQWATKRLETASRLGHYDSATGKGSMAESIAAVLEASAMTVGVAEQSGMISREFADDFRSKFKHFVAIPGANKFGFGEVGGVGLQGRSRFAAEFDMGLSQQSEETPDVIAYTFANLRHRIVEAEVNRSNQAIADFALANPNAGVFTVYLHPDEVRVQTDLDGNPYYELPPGFRTMTGPGVIEGIPGTQDKLREYEQREGLIPVYRNGVLRHFRIEHEGLRKSYERTMNPAKQGWLMKQLGKVNRYLIGVNTMLNPEFLIPNLFRDAGAAMNTLAIQGTVAGISGKTGTGFVKEFAPRIRHAMRALYAQNFGKNIDQLSGEAAKIAGYIEEFERSGGKIQWPYMESAVETMKNMEDSIAAIQGRANLRQKAIAFGGTAKDFMKRAADIFENATRLSAFVTARENGVSVERAAMLSREITVDFDRKGDVGQAFNTLYLFANAGLQGTLVIARAIRNNPQRAAKHLSAFVGLSFSLALANILMGGDDDDGEPSYFAIPEETRNGNLIIMLPFSDGTPLRIPLPYGYAFFWAVGQEMVNAVFGRTGAGKATLGILSSALNNFNPLESAAGLRDAHGFARLGAPTLIDPFVDIFFEQTAFGTPLMPEKTFEQQPDSTRHWRSVSTTSKEAARLLNEAFGGSGGKSSGLTDISPETLDLAYETITGGLGKFLGRTLGLIMAPVSGRELGANDLPIARRFIGGKLNWEDRGRFKSNYAEIQGANRTMKNLRDNVNMAKIPELKQQAIRDRDDFMRENGHLLAMRAEANRVVSRIGDLDKQKERLYKSGLPDSQIRPQLKVLDEKQKTIFAAFNEKYYKAVDLN